MPVRHPLRNESRPLFALVAFAIAVMTSIPARAQGAAPPIGPFVVDLRATFPNFPDNSQVAASHGIDNPADLPGHGFGIDLGGHVYMLKWRVITFGVGAELMMGGSRSTPAAPTGQAVTEHLTSFAPQISLNFGSGNGWSYLSGGIGYSTWSIVPDEAEKSPADEERLFTVNYGAGARWFAKKHLAFCVDVRYYAISQGTTSVPVSPHTTMFVIGAGVSVK
jgi:hypothetical protein